MENWLNNFNVFNIAATGAAIWVFFSNWWIIILLGILYLVSRNKGEKVAHRGTPEVKQAPKHLPTKDEVVNMLFDLYVK